MIKVSPFRRQDLDGVLSVILPIQQEEFGIPVTISDQPDLLDIPGFYQNGKGNFWVALSDNQVVGTIALLDIGNSQAALRKMFVKASFRGQGLGVASSLLAALLAWCRLQGIDCVFLGTTAEFHAAHRFYEKNGFTEMPRSDLPRAFPVMKVDSKFYRLQLPVRRPVEIREERPEDAAAIRRVNELAFGGMTEADLVDVLRASCPGILSLAAMEGSEVVGHILFSPAIIEGREGRLEGMGLAPMAVLPERQRRGIGSSLVRTGLAKLRAASCRFVIVLGHAEYYPRFGFVKASAHGVQCQWEGVPDEAFMICVLDEGILPSIAGTAWYREEFAGIM